MYQNKLSILIALLFVAAGSVYYFSELSVSETEKRPEPRVDSLDADDHPSISARTDTVPPPVGENLPPGTALIRATILAAEEIEKATGKITIQVDEIIGYGSSTPPISTGTEFSLDVLHYLQRNPKVRNQIRVDGEIKVLISYQEGMKLNDSKKKQNWTFVEFKNK